MKYKERYRKERKKEIKVAEILAGVLAFAAIISIIIGLAMVETIPGLIITIIGFVCLTIWTSNAEYYEKEEEDDEC